MAQDLSIQDAKTKLNKVFDNEEMNSNSPTKKKNIFSPIELLYIEGNDAKFDLYFLIFGLEIVQEVFSKTVTNITNGFFSEFLVNCIYGPDLCMSVKADWMQHLGCKVHESNQHFNKMKKVNVSWLEGEMNFDLNVNPNLSDKCNDILNVIL